MKYPSESDLPQKSGTKKAILRKIPQKTPPDKATVQRRRSDPLSPKKEPRSVNDLPPYERGLYYEDFACRWLKKKGYKILDRNYRGRKRSELDLVAKDGETLVFIEVKSRRRKSRHTPLRSLHVRKRSSLARACADYVTDLIDSGVDTKDLDLRFDVIAIDFDEAGVPTALDHYPAYWVIDLDSV